MGIMSTAVIEEMYEENKSASAWNGWKNKTLRSSHLRGGGCSLEVNITNCLIVV